MQPNRYHSPRPLRLWLIVLVALLSITALAGAPPATARPPEPTSTPNELASLVVRIRIARPAEVQQLIEQGIDVLEMREGDDIFALVTPHEQDALAASGWDVRSDPQQSAMLQQQAAPRIAQEGGYRTVDEMEQFLHEMAARYPDLTTLVDFGDTWERGQFAGSSGYDLLALRMTNHLTPGPKPVFFLMATIHAREVVPAEIALRFISYLLEGYGSDPDVTWLLNEHEMVVAPMTNPDGYKLVEQGFMQRKNTNISYGGFCVTPPLVSDQYGVDLNRNFAFQWGSIASPDTDPCAQTFPGGSAASEPETQALQAFLASLFPDHPRPADGNAAPGDTDGILITLHSYSDLVLWPWGYTLRPSPNAEGLQRLGERLARFNGYQPQQSYGLYPTSGTTDDWSYANLGIASYTFEVGPISGSCGGFVPPYRCLDEGSDGAFWPRNLPALLYAARVARAPYTQPGGPEITHMQVLSDTLPLTRTTRRTMPVSDTQPLTVVLTLDGQGQPVTAAEISLGASPWLDASPIALSPVDGAFDSESEQAQGVLSVQQILEAGHNIYQEQVLLLARGQNGRDTWGPIQAHWLPSMQIPGPEVGAVEIVSDTRSLTLTTSLHDATYPISDAELFVGTSPLQDGTPIALVPLDGAFDAREEAVQATLPVTQVVAEGYYQERHQMLLMVRGKNGAGSYGPVQTVWIADDVRWFPRHRVWLPAVLGGDTNFG